MNRSSGEIEAFKALSRIKRELDALDSKLEFVIGDHEDPQTVIVNLEGHGEFEIKAKYGCINAVFFSKLMAKIKEKDYE
ncbi:MAG: hypothetical protein QM489_00940 [Candidatus Izemoplasma sp.]